VEAARDGEVTGAARRAGTFDFFVMAGEGRPSTSLLPATRKDVDADLRQHDDVEATVAPRGALISPRILI
jgi:DNA-nicking Smr family endonuclease